MAITKSDIPEDMARRIQRYNLDPGHISLASPQVYDLVILAARPESELATEVDRIVFKTYGGDYEHPHEPFRKALRLEDEDVLKYLAAARTRLVKELKRQEGDFDRLDVYAKIAQEYAEDYEEAEI